MSDNVRYRQMRPGDAQPIYDMIERAFNEFVAPGYKATGVAGFLDYAAPDLLEHRSENDHFVLVATVDEAIVGMIEVREHHHVSLFFVEGACHGRGIGRQLMMLALAHCQEDNPALTKLTVNSSPYALPVYQHLGFRQTEPVQEEAGVRYIPMERQILPDEAEDLPAPGRENVSTRQRQMMAEIAQMVEDACARDSNIFGYGIWTHHIQQVAENARRLAELFGADAEIVELAAWLHDYASVKDASMIEEHHIHGALLAEEVLERYQLPGATIEAVKHCIETHRGSVPLERRSLEANCLADADALTHIKSAPALLHLAYVKRGMGIDEGADWVRAKLTRSWNKLSPAVQDLAWDDYRSAMQTLGGDVPPA